MHIICIQIFDNNATTERQRDIQRKDRQTTDRPDHSLCVPYLIEGLDHILTRFCRHEHPTFNLIISKDVVIVLLLCDLSGANQINLQHNSEESDVSNIND
jgi:hypothetical protein